LYRNDTIGIVVNYIFGSRKKKIMRRLSSGNTCYSPVQDLCTSFRLSKNLKIKMYKIIILPLVLYGCETWSVTLREVIKWGCYEEYLDLRRGNKACNKLHKENIHNLD
jgi:hypothetical protein